MTHRTLIAAVAVLALMLALPAGAAEPPDRVEPDRPTPWEDAPAGVETAPDLWFVELASPPTSEGTPPGQIQRERAQLRTQASAQGLRYTERRSYADLFNGFSVQADATTAGALAALPSVRAIYPVAVVPLPDAPVTSPQLTSALAMTGADTAQSELGLTGEGVRVAIIDSGIDYEHPDLGGGFGPGFKVEVGFDYVGDDFNAQVPGSTPAPNPDPMDCNGHGTHVAGIVGALAADEDGVTGVAPGVTLGAYRVFGCQGSTTADVIMDALEDAYADGMDVVNMSLGAAFTWPQYPTSEASDRLVEQGVVVVASIGNSGASGVYSAGSPGLGEHVIGVASFDNTEIPARTFLVDPDSESEQQVPYLTMSNAPEPPEEGTTPPLVHVGRGCNVEAPDVTEDDEYLDDPDGAVALIERGACTFQNKYQRAADAGAVGVIIYNNVPGLFAGGGITPREGVWAAAIGDADGQMLVDLIDVRDEDVTITWTPDRMQAPSPTGGLISSFSSFGLSPDLDLKPDLGAPGGLITSTYPLDQGGYATISGTSMSAPHVAGGVALLLEAAPDTAADAVRGILQNTAAPAAWSLAPTAGFLDNVHRQGAGMMRIDDAILTTTSVTPSKLSLGASGDGIPTTTLTVANAGDVDVTYTVGHAGALSTAGSTYAPGYYLPAGQAELSTDTLTVPAGGTATFEVTITPATLTVVNHQYGGYVVLTPEDEDGQTLRVPYAGYEGDYQELTVLGDEASDNVAPRVARITDDGVAPVEAGHRFATNRGELPVLQVNYGHHAESVRIAVRNVESGETIPVLEATKVSRSGGPEDRTSYVWDGTRSAGSSDRRAPAEPGRYVFEVEVGKALGDPTNPAHVETWTSPEFRVDPSNRGGGR